MVSPYFIPFPVFSQFPFSVSVLILKTNRRTSLKA